MQAYLNESIADVIDLEASRREDAEYCTPECTFTEMLLHFVVDNFRGKALWPPRALNWRPLDMTWQNLEDVHWTYSSLDNSKILQCSGGKCVGAELGDDGIVHISTLLETIKQRSQSMIRPLCYQCVREGRLLKEHCEHSQPDGESEDEKV